MNAVAIVREKLGKTLVVEINQVMGDPNRAEIIFRAVSEKKVADTFGLVAGKDYWPGPFWDSFKAIVKVD